LSRDQFANFSCPTQIFTFCAQEQRKTNLSNAFLFRHPLTRFSAGTSCFYRLGIECPNRPIQTTTAWKTNIGPTSPDEADPETNAQEASFAIPQLPSTQTSKASKAPSEGAITSFFKRKALNCLGYLRASSSNLVYPKHQMKHRKRGNFRYLE
jgi:hypothetical protein